MTRSTWALSASILLLFLPGCGGNVSSVPVVTSPTPTPTSTARQWAWVSGNAYAPTGLGQAGVYGVQGTAAATNSPGSRGVGFGWGDSSGNLWMFGGFGLDSAGVTAQELNDLWKYSPTTNQWTWVNGSNKGAAASVYGTLGVGAAGNVPSARHGAGGWTDTSGNAWIFGGLGLYNNGAGQLNDLWMYAPSSNVWTWMGGSKAVSSPGVYGTKGAPSGSNIPSARQFPMAWSDANGNFWLFGGYGIVSSGGTAELNDLWRYSPATQQWTWINGTSLPQVSGIYGTLGIASSINQPGGRSGATVWSDGSGNLWMFGGFGIDSIGTRSRLNDLWAFSTTTQQWTWVGGSNKADAAGAYGVQGTASAVNVPGARNGAAGWKDGSGNLWLFGGIGEVSTVTSGDLNDLWSFNTSTKLWTWVGGTNQLNAAGTYGTKGTPDAANVPGGRESAIPLTDSSGRFWLFGGYAANANGPTATAVSDLWRYQP